MRKTCFALLALALCLLLAGCHGQTSRQAMEIPETFDESKPIDITFWAKNDTNKTQVEIYEQAIAAFEALYPSVTVNMRLYTDYGRIYNDVITNIATGTTPNVCISYPDHIATYLTGSNVVAQLDSLMADVNYGLGGSKLKFDGPEWDEIVPQFLAECVLNGGTYALPFMRSTEACYVNKTMVEALGFELPEVLTWDFVWEVSEAAAAKDEDGVFLANGQKVMIPFIYKSTDNMMIQMLRQKDAGYSTDTGEILIFNDTTEALLLDIAEHVKKGAFSTFKISSYPAFFLNAGQCVFAVDSTAGATWMGSDAPLSDIPADQFVEFETAVYPVPQFDPAHPQMISQGPSMCIFNKPDNQEVLASWLFMQYLLTNDVQTAYARTEGYVPVTTKAQNDPAYQDYLSRAGEDNNAHYAAKIEASQLLLEHTGDTFVTPVFNGSTSLGDAAGKLIENVTKSIRGKQTVDEALIDKLYDDMI
ncbi:MAG: extracellular solute-binding protein, partial [Clostridia bacterium]|nr:extracellular solute-binding protein [Clostridia bacterium]